ncbi:MAG TPA: hypothetical protein VFT65_17395 [Candidatus Angelobacter sp.]|nr:hypothetical protein [Candidatus Angelobacter sp.]
MDSQEKPRKRIPAIVAGVLLTLTVQSSMAMMRAPAGQKGAPAPETSMLFAPQDNDPVRITQASFAADNSLLDAQLENKSHQKIQSYRLGWAVARKDEIKLGKTEAIDVPSGVDTTAAFTIQGPSSAAKEDAAKHPPAIVFYVAELQFADGKRWQADVKQIKKEVAEMVK